ncbi:hypothetical protein DXV76_11335 [Rhodobacteraceae bacterium CCMM004]|nr:hypothetical protein DXV76_11335 [Rhodobacteraceae bacterium CCMM004]
MPLMEIAGRDIATGHYRVRFVLDGVERRGEVPETLVAPGRPSHRAVYEWIAAHRAQIERAFARRARGETPRPPYDRLTLLED